MEKTLTLNLTIQRANKLIALLNFAISKGEYPVAMEACPFITELVEKGKELETPSAE